MTRMEVSPIVKMDRSKVAVLRAGDKQSDFVDLPAEQCVGIVWELTREAWSLTGDNSAEQRLQRDVATLKKQ